MRRSAEKSAAWTRDRGPPTQWHRDGESIRERCARVSHACHVEESRRRLQTVAPRSDTTMVHILQCAMDGAPLKASKTIGGGYVSSEGPATTGLPKLLRARHDCVCGGGLRRLRPGRNTPSGARTKSVADITFAYRHSSYRFRPDRALSRSRGHRVAQANGLLAAHSITRNTRHAGILKPPVCASLVARIAMPPCPP